MSLWVFIIACFRYFHYFYDILIVAVMSGEPGEREIDEDNNYVNETGGKTFSFIYIQMVS